MLAEDVKITKQVEDSRYGLDGTRTAFIRVEFFVGKHGPFVERFEKETFTADVRDAKLCAFADQVRTT
jgi:hypothetical protein